VSGSPLVDVTLRDHVALLQLTNAERRNVLDVATATAMQEAVERLGRDPDVRCVVIAGSGGTFAAGADIRELESASAEENLAYNRRLRASVNAVAALPMPTIAALNGHAIGGGLEVALSCDIRIAAREIKVGMPPAKLGLVYSHTGLAKFLEACGPAVTAELFYVGRNVDAERGREMGLLNYVVEPGELDRAAEDMASEIAGNAPLSVSGNKRILRALRGQAAALPAELERELVELRESCFSTEDFREGVRAFAEKRAPRWQGR
jgi:enoyl-CoA hydratase/carnithine racemase